MDNKKKVKMKWAKSDDPNVFNFGDDLGPYIVKHLSCLKIEYIHYAMSRRKILRKFLSDIYRRKGSLKLVNDFFRSFFTREYLITAGSILQWYSSKRCIVWGSGIIDNNENLIPAKKYYAVRGEYTQKKISEIGVNDKVSLGDPGLLLPLIYNPKIEKKFRLGIIPHYIHYESIKKSITHNDVLIIKLADSNIENIIDQINSCDCTISTSLHGLIVSHAYGINSTWYKIKNKELQGDDIKFFDYFSSVKIPEYIPREIDIKLEIDKEEIIRHTHFNKEINQIKIDLNRIQLDLLKSAPFELKTQFKEIVKNDHSLDKDKIAL
jgi:pyruvyltransferase